MIIPNIVGESKQRLKKHVNVQHKVFAMHGDRHQYRKIVPVTYLINPIHYSKS